MDNFLRQGYFLLGILGTLLIWAFAGDMIEFGIAWATVNALLWIGWGFLCRYFRIGRPQ